jgi:hypothetical protein
MNYGLRAALASTPVLLLLSATLCALADDTVNATLEDASVWFAISQSDTSRTYQHRSFPSLALAGALASGVSEIRCWDAARPSMK